MVSSKTNHNLAQAQLRTASMHSSAKSVAWLLRARPLEPCSVPVHSCWALRSRKSPARSYVHRYGRGLRSHLLLPQPQIHRTLGTLSNFPPLPRRHLRSLSFSSSPSGVNAETPAACQDLTQF